MMKLNAKKLTAAVTTAAVAFSSMACACITASADTSGEPTSRYFYQDFEDEQFQKVTVTTGKWKYKGNDTERLYINNGATASKILAADTLYLFEGDMYQNQYTTNEDGTTTVNQAPIDLNNLNKKSDGTNSDYSLTKEQMKALDFNTDNIHFGGIDGYVGITPSICEQSWAYKYQGGNVAVAPMMIQRQIKDDVGFDSNKLVMYTKGNNSATACGDAYAMFGREGMDLYGKKSHISVVLTPRQNMSGNRYFTLTLTKNWGKIKETIQSRTSNMATYPVTLWDIFDLNGKKNLQGGATDVVTVNNDKIYVGLVSEANEIELSESLNFNNKTSYKIDAYIDYKTNPKEPTVTAVISNSAGKIIGSKTGLLPVSADGTEYTTHYIEGQGSKNIFANAGLSKKASFTPEAADENGYGVFSVLNSVNAGDCGVYIDNFLFEDVTTSLSGSIGTDNKTVSAALTGGKGTSGKLIAAAYDADTNELLAVKPADVSTLATEYETKTITFDNVVADNAKVKLYYWNDYSSMTPLADAYAVR